MFKSATLSAWRNQLRLAKRDTVPLHESMVWVGGKRGFEALVPLDQWAVCPWNISNTRLHMGKLERNQWNPTVPLFPVVY